MSTYNVGSEAQLKLWNGTDNVLITNSFDITSDTGFPVTFNGTSDITFGGNQNLSPYVITIKIPSGNVWNGLVRFGNSATGRIQFQFLQINIETGRLGSDHSAFLSSSNEERNPHVKFFMCAVQVLPTVTYANNPSRWAGFLCGLRTDRPFPASGYLIEKCSYIGPITNRGGGFVATGYVGGDVSTTTTVTLTGCFAEIRQPAGLDPVNGGGFVGNQMEKHTLIVDQCIVNISVFPTVGTEPYGGFCGSQSGDFSISNSYVVLTATSNSPGTFYFIASDCTSKAKSVTNCYFVRSGSDTTALNSFNDDSSNFTIQNCAFQDGYTYNQSSTWENNITDYTYNTDIGTPPSLIAPFNSWNLSTIWAIGQSPLILQTFQQSPYDPSTYTSSDDTPSFTNLCIFEGTRLLTTVGYVNVEDLTLEHRLITVDGRDVSIKHIHSNYNPSVQCVKIPIGFFGKECPCEDVYITLWHALYGNGQYMHPLHHRNIFNDLTAKAKEFGKTTYYCIQPEDYYRDILVASNMPIEGYGGPEANRHWLDCVQEEKCELVMHQSLVT